MIVSAIVYRRQTGESQSPSHVFEVQNRQCPPTYDYNRGTNQYSGLRRAEPPYACFADFDNYRMVFEDTQYDTTAHSLCESSWNQMVGDTRVSVCVLG